MAKMNFPWGITREQNTLKLLFWFRAASIIGQVVACLLATFIFDFPLNGWAVTLVIAGLAAVNGITLYRANLVSDASDTEVFIQLLIDISALTALFFFSGGATNPFVSMYLLPLAISAVLLPKSWVWVLAIISIAAYSFLMWWFPNEHAHHQQSFGLHVLGMWVSFVLSATVMAYFVVKMRSALQQKDHQLALAKERVMNDEKLVSLGALAASTAHEMGTPLGTIQLIISDLEENKITQDDIDILLQQVSRCKEALAEMSTSAGTGLVESDGVVKFEEYINQLLTSWQKTRPNVQLNRQLNGADTAGVVASKTLSKALINLLDNAADASPESVSIEAHWQNDQAQLTIIDRGEGIDPTLIKEIGVRPYSTKPEGIGLGAFLAHEIIQRLGGAIKLSNRTVGGVETLITLPLQPIK